MCEVTNKNFEEKYPQVMDDLQSALFISIDCEFSGLFDDEFKSSLFDSPKVRFQKLQNSFKNLLIIQFGLSTFKYNRNSNTFTASTYTFYLVPSTLLKNSKFTGHLRSIEFLCKHNFDFNKLFYDGIRYLIESDEAELVRMIKGKSVQNLGKIKDVQDYCSEISHWFHSSSDNAEMLLNVSEDTTFECLLHMEIRKRFPYLWTYFEKPGVIKIRKLTTLEKNELLLNKEEDVKLKEKFVDSVLGFSKIMKEIEKLKKPVVGHNFLMDLIMIYKQFYNASPVSYNEFKKAITNIFPNVYDTKSMSFELRHLLSKNDSWHSNSLLELYTYLSVGKGSTVVIFSPRVNHTNEEIINKKNIHEAGFDSYCAGYCFLKMAHIFSLWNAEKKTFLLTSFQTSSSWLLSAVQPMKNKVNISRAQVNYIVLDNDDPGSTRPDVLLIQSKTKLPLNIPKVIEEIEKYASVDIQLLNRHSGIMAVSNKKELKEVLQHFENHEKVCVTKYNLLKHSRLGRMMLAGTVIASVIFLAISTSKNWSKP